MNNIDVSLFMQNKLEISIFITEVEFNEFVEERINNSELFEQYFERNDGTWNKLNISKYGTACIGFSSNIPTNTMPTEYRYI